jgi:hypothetical protein
MRVSTVLKALTCALVVAVSIFAVKQLGALYSVVFAGFLLVTAVAALVTFVLWLVEPWRRLLGFAWRMWLWATIGLVTANALGFLVLLLFLELVKRVPPGSRVDLADVLHFAQVVVIEPFLASGVGLLVGLGWGWYAAARNSRGAPSV